MLQLFRALSIFRLPIKNIARSSYGISRNYIWLHIVTVFSLDVAGYFLFCAMYINFFSLNNWFGKILLSIIFNLNCRYYFIISISLLTISMGVWKFYNYMYRCSNCTYLYLSLFAIFSVVIFTYSRYLVLDLV